MGKRDNEKEQIYFGRVMEMEARIKADLIYEKAIIEDNELRMRNPVKKPEILPEKKLLPGYSALIKNEMTIEQRNMPYVERIKLWKIHGMLVDKNFTMDQYQADQMKECRPISPKYTFS